MLRRGVRNKAISFERAASRSFTGLAKVPQYRRYGQVKAMPEDFVDGKWQLHRTTLAPTHYTHNIVHHPLYSMKLTTQATKDTDGIMTFSYIMISKTSRLKFSSVLGLGLVVS